MCSSCYVSFSNKKVDITNDDESSILSESLTLSSENLRDRNGILLSYCDVPDCTKCIVNNNEAKSVSAINILYGKRLAFQAIGNIIVDSSTNDEKLFINNDNTTICKSKEFIKVTLINGNTVFQPGNLTDDGLNKFVDAIYSLVNIESQYHCFLCLSHTSSIKSSHGRWQPYQGTVN